MKTRDVIWWIIGIGAGCFALYYAVKVVNANRIERARIAAVQAATPSLAGLKWVKATPDGYGEPIMVEGRQFSFNTSPKADVDVSIVRMDGTTEDKSSPANGAVDLGGGVKMLRFKSKVPTTVYVTVK